AGVVLRSGYFCRRFTLVAVAAAPGTRLDSLLAELGSALFSSGAKGRSTSRVEVFHDRILLVRRIFLVVGLQTGRICFARISVVGVSAWNVPSAWHQGR